MKEESMQYLMLCSEGISKMINWKYCIEIAVLFWIINFIIPLSRDNYLFAFISGIVVGYLVNNQYKNGAMNGFATGIITGLIDLTLSLMVLYYTGLFLNPMIETMVIYILVGVLLSIFLCTVGGIVGSWTKLHIKGKISDGVHR